MKGGSSRSRRQIAELALGLAALLLPAAAPAGLSVAVARIGRATAGAENRSEARHADAAFYVGPKEAVAFKVAGSFPPQARLYPLVRRAGQEVWTVQPEAVGPGGRKRAGEWTAEVRFGRPADDGARFELRAIVAAEPLPPVPVPEGMRTGTTLAESAIVQVERRRGRPSVAVSAVGGHDVYGNPELMVHEEDTVEVTARDLPAESRVGVAVQPTGTAKVWVMPGKAGESGAILGYFGVGDGSELSFHYKVSAFVAREDAWPPVNLGLPPLEWQRHQARFLAESWSVPVVRWQRQLRIEEIGGIPVQPGLVLAVDRQADVRGAAQRPLAPGERIWTVCIPLRGNPWIAGWTYRLTPSGHWGLKAVQLQKDGHPEPFDVVAVVSADDAMKVRPEALRQWLHGVESEDASTRITVAAPGARPPSPPTPGRRRP